LGAGVFLTAGLLACEPLDDDREVHVQKEEVAYITLEEVAGLLSSVPLGTAQMQEVLDAATASAGNGYDEEYRMADLFTAPGTGVGAAPETEADLPPEIGMEPGGRAGKWAHGPGTKAEERYRTPLRELLAKAVEERFATKAGADSSSLALAYLDSLVASDVQIYWPFSESWDGESLPVITFDPGDYAEQNEGYEFQADGSLKKVLVDEQMALERPVWVVNRNADAQHKTLELLRREDPSWGQGGGDIVVRPSGTKAGTDIKTLVLKSFKANRQFDSWFCGGSEFFIKLGSVEDFNATTEAELRLYQPTITDFMVVVRRRQVGESLPLNTMLVSEWTEQLSDCALMIVEDDGGTHTSWKCKALVKYGTKNYGVELELPYNSRDDIVWRGSLTRTAVERFNGKVAHFGDVELVLELI